jgi:hypothetical protein
LPAEIAIFPQAAARPQRDEISVSSCLRQISYVNLDVSSLMRARHPQIPLYRISFVVKILTPNPRWSIASAGRHVLMMRQTFMPAAVVTSHNGRFAHTNRIETRGLKSTLR